MQHNFNTIADFIKIRDKCLFCQGPLRAVLTNFIGLRKSGIPILRAPLEGSEIKFDIKHTTQSYSIEASGIIDINTNILSFEVAEAGHNTPAIFLNATPSLDQFIAKQSFEDLKPYIEIMCQSRSCKMGYHLCGYPITLIREQNTNNCNISPFKLYLESFKTKRLNIQNDCISNVTNIYSRMNEEADPIKVPLIDFQAMGKDRLLTRVKTLVTFS